MVLENTSSVSYGDGWSYTYHTATREEAALILSLLANVHPAFMDSDNEIRSIISQETEAFYSGQKTVEETVKIIQNRVSLYVSENRRYPLLPCGIGFHRERKPCRESTGNLYSVGRYGGRSL